MPADTIRYDRETAEHIVRSCEFFAELHRVEAIKHEPVSVAYVVNDSFRGAYQTLAKAIRSRLAEQSAQEESDGG